VKWLDDARIRALTRSEPVPPLIHDRYRIAEPIGAGGMGLVYLADDTALGRRVAVKIIDAADETGELAERLLSEARVLARLEHPGIVPVHDVGALPDGRVFYVMKFVDGQTLADFAATEAPLAARLRAFARVCEAVAFAHSRGVVHRDLTPRNVMVGAFGETVVLDWGLAGGGSDAAIGGTRGFMAPEQAEGRAGDARSDVYALGAILQILLEPGSAAAALNAVVRKAMATDPAHRYPTAAALGDDVLRFLEAAPVSAHRYTALETARRWLVRNRVIVSLVAAYVVMRVAVALFVGR